MPLEYLLTMLMMYVMSTVIKFFAVPETSMQEETMMIIRERPKNSLVFGSLKRIYL